MQRRAQQKRIAGIELHLLENVCHRVVFLADRKKVRLEMEFLILPFFCELPALEFETKQSKVPAACGVGQ